MKSVYLDPYKSNVYSSRVPVELKNKKEVGYVRVFHASPDAAAVDVYVDGHKTISGLKFGQATPYVDLPVGTRTFIIYAAGTKNKVFSVKINIFKYQYITVAAIDYMKRIKPFVVTDNQFPSAKNKTKMRAIHLAPDAPAVDIYAAQRDSENNYEEVFEDVRFGDITDYVQLKPDTYIIQVRIHRKDVVVLEVPKVRMKASIKYSIYVIGEAGKNSLQAVLLPDASMFK